MKTIPLGHDLVALVDDADYDWLTAYKWHTINANGRLYASRMTLRPDGKWRRILMHRAILGEPVGFQVDHWDNNRLNNQRANLRAATRKLNAGNAGLSRTNTTGFKGVHPHRNGRFNAHIRGKHLGYFPTVEDAARAYDTAARSAFGDFARVNYPLPGEQGCREVSA